MPPERRPAHVKPTRSAQPVPDAPDTDDPVALSRTEVATNVAERRRLRRLKKSADSNELPPIAIPRDMPFRIYVSIRWFSGLLVALLVVVLYLFLTRDTFFIHQIGVGGTHYLTPPEIFERSGLANMHISW